MKIAIIGAGVGGLACARECEKLGIIPDVFERNNTVGWTWLAADIWLNDIERKGSDILAYLKDNFGLILQPIAECKTIIIKSPNKEVRIQGKHGYFIPKGMERNSLEKQLMNEIKSTSVHFNRPADYKELSEKHDYVVIATGKETAAKELGVWEDCGRVHIREAMAVGSFDINTSNLYFDTEYAGHGYARILPLRPTQAMIGLANISTDETDLDSLFTKFIEKEDLAHLEFVFKLSEPIYSTGRVSKFRVGNVLLVGRAAGLTDRFMGFGGINAILSGILAARAIIKDMDYDKMIKPLKDHTENVSAFRQPLEKFENNDFDRLISLIGTPGIKQLLYNSGINFVDFGGSVLKMMYH